MMLSFTDLLGPLPTPNYTISNMVLNASKVILLPELCPLLPMAFLCVLKFMSVVEKIYLL
jgi:hypothetical protein